MLVSTQPQNSYPMSSKTVAPAVAHQGANTYTTLLGPITIYPVATPYSNANPLGFILRIDQVENEGHDGVDTYPRSTSPFTQAESESAESTLEEIIPYSLQDHLIIVTPPPSTMFPMRYPRNDSLRVWCSPVNTGRILQGARARQTLEVTIPPYNDYLMGSQRIQPGDLLLVNQTGYFITYDIGPLPTETDVKEEWVAVEGRTITGEVVILRLPRRYMEQPDFSAESIEEGIYKEGEDEMEEEED